MQKSAVGSSHWTAIQPTVSTRLDGKETACNQPHRLPPCDFGQSQA
ncbi:MAG: hypothetical protein M3014_05765 [Chloroflexota bacterium]|nr:hypothetical protein [Chloroflexota bacterium]